MVERNGILLLIKIKEIELSKKRKIKNVRKLLEILSNKRSKRSLKMSHPNKGSRIWVRQQKTNCWR